MSDNSVVNFISNQLTSKGLNISKLQIEQVMSEYYNYHLNHGSLTEDLGFKESDLLPYFKYKRGKLLAGEKVHELGIGLQYLDCRRNSRYTDTESDARKYVSVFKCIMDPQLKTESEDLINPQE